MEGDAWYAGYIQAAAELKLIEGFDDGIFHPDDAITRAQACAIINWTLGRVPDADRMSIRPLVTWPDCDEDAWYYADMMEATNSHDYQWITVEGQKTENGRKICPSGTGQLWNTHGLPPTLPRAAKWWAEGSEKIPP